MTATDAYFKKVIPFRDFGQTTHYRVSQDLFSSFDIDVGTKFLLRTLLLGADVRPFRSVLDLGCGYGPIGLTLHKLSPERIVHMVDRDALAVAFARENAALNGASAGVEVYGSLGYDDVRRGDFDLIVSNIPAKAGEPVIASLLRDSAHYLSPGGFVAVVVISPLEEMVAKVLSDLPDVSVLLSRARPGHTVFHYQFAPGTRRTTNARPSAFERGVYRHERIEVSGPGISYTLETVHGPPELEGPDLDTATLLDGIRALGDRAIERAVVFHPGQGHVPVALAKLLRPRSISLVDRDLLALRNARLNLALNGFPEQQLTLSHQIGMVAPDQEPADLIAGVLREGEGPAAIELGLAQAARQLSPGGLVMLAGSSTALTRVVKSIEGRRLFAVEDRTREAGHGVLTLRAVDRRDRQ